MEELTERLAAPRAVVRELTPNEIEILQALGYHEDTDAPADTPQLLAE
jgi:hypothetical protein